jgi:hypothetical protein
MNPTAIVKVYSPQAVVKVTGLPGLKGEKGDGSTLEHPTTVALGGNRAVAMTSNGINYADSLNTGATLGFTKYAIDANATATILLGGDLNGFSGLTIGSLIYLASNGTITQTPPTVGTLQILGVAISDTKINIQIQPPIFLG